MATGALNQFALSMEFVLHVALWTRQTSFRLQVFLLTTKKFFTVIKIFDFVNLSDDVI